MDDLYRFWGTREPRVEVKKTLLMGLVGLVMAFIAPYDTSDMPTGLWRITYWVSLLLFGSVITGPIARSCWTAMTARLKHPALLLLAYAALISVPVFFVVVGTDICFHALRFTGNAPTADYALKFLGHVGSEPLSVLFWYAQVVTITYMAVGAISLFVIATRPKPEPDKKGPPPGYLFLRRLPASLGQGLLCLQMEDHYIRAYTDRGDTLVRMRLKDAVAELDGFSGLQVHRSWWVALDAVEAVRKDGRRHLIQLKGGMKVPVSKTFEDGLRDAGYL